MSEFKTLATCKPSEFLRQTVKIKKAVQNWLNITNIMSIIKKAAPQELIPENAAEFEIEAIAQKNMEARRKQIIKNIGEAFDAALEEHPDETLKILALCCFIDPEKADDHTVSEYINAFNSLISDKTTIDFFVSLAQLGQMNISDVAKA